jgi:hypothetical protein
MSLDISSEKDPIVRISVQNERASKSIKEIQRITLCNGPILVNVINAESMNLMQLHRSLGDSSKIKLVSSFPASASSSTPKNGSNQTNERGHFSGLINSVSDNQLINLLNTKVINIDETVSPEYILDAYANGLKEAPTMASLIEVSPSMFLEGSARGKISKVVVDRLASLNQVVATNNYKAITTEIYEIIWLMKIVGEDQSSGSKSELLVKLETILALVESSKMNDLELEVARGSLPPEILAKVGDKFERLSDFLESSDEIDSSILECLKNIPEMLIKQRMLENTLSADLEELAGLPRLQSLSRILTASESSQNSDRKKSFYVVQVPIPFRGAEATRRKLLEITNRFTSEDLGQDRVVRFVFGINLPFDAKEEDKNAMAAFSQSYSSEHVTVTSFVWDRLPGLVNAKKVNYAGLRNQLMDRSQKAIRDVIELAKSENSKFDVSILILDPDTTIDERWLESAEKMKEVSQNLVTAAHYHLQRTNPSAFSDSNPILNTWVPLLVDTANKHDAALKKAIAEKTYLNYTQSTQSSANCPRNVNALRENLKFLENMVEGINYRVKLVKEGSYRPKRESREVAVSKMAANLDVLKALITYHESLLLNFSNEGYPKHEKTSKDNSIIMLKKIIELQSHLNKSGALSNAKIPGEEVLYPSEAFLIFTVFERNKQSPLDLSKSYGSSFWGGNSATSESQAAILQYSRAAREIDPQRKVVKFLGGEPYASETPGRHYESVKSNLSANDLRSLQYSERVGQLDSRSQEVVKKVIGKLSQSSFQEAFFIQRESYILEKAVKSSQIREDTAEILITQLAGDIKQLQDENLNSAVIDVNKQIRNMHSIAQMQLPIAPTLSRPGAGSNTIVQPEYPEDLVSELELPAIPSQPSSKHFDLFNQKSNVASHLNADFHSQGAASASPPKLGKLSHSPPINGRRLAWDDTSSSAQEVRTVTHQPGKLDERYPLIGTKILPSSQTRESAQVKKSSRNGPPLPGASSFQYPHARSYFEPPKPSNQTQPQSANNFAASSHIAPERARVFSGDRGNQASRLSSGSSVRSDHQQFNRAASAARSQNQSAHQPYYPSLTQARQYNSVSRDLASMSATNARAGRGARLNNSESVKRSPSVSPEGGSWTKVGR